MVKCTKVRNTKGNCNAMFNRDNQPKKPRLQGKRPRYRYGYEEVGGVCGVSGAACRQWFRRRGWKLGEDGVANLSMVVRYVVAVGTSRRPLPIPDNSGKPEKAPKAATKPICRVPPLSEVKKRYAGEMNDKMAALLGAMGGAMGGSGVVEEESAWEVGRKAWMLLAERVELGGGLDDDAEWGEYNSGVIKYGSR